MIDLRNKPVEITISEDRETVWVNTDEGCQFRAEKIPELKIVDSRKKKTEFIAISQRANWMFMLFIGGGFGFGYLFGLLGLNTGAGAIIGSILGGVAGYFIGRKYENRENESESNQS